MLSYKEKRIKDLPSISDSLVFIEYDVKALKNKFDQVIALVDKPASMFGDIPLQKVRIEPDPDDDLDGWHIFIPHLLFHNSYWFYKYNHLIQEAHQFVFDEILREGFERDILKIDGEYITGDHLVIKWLSIKHRAGAKCNFLF